MLSNIINVANNGLKGNGQFLFSYISQTRCFTSIQHNCLNNSKNTKHRHISLPGTDLCKSFQNRCNTLKIFSFKRTTTQFIQYFRKLVRKSKSKGLILKDCVFFCEMRFCFVRRVTTLNLKYSTPILQRNSVFALLLPSIYITV